MSIEEKVRGWVMSSKEDHTDIALVSMIIKDGVKNYEELAKRYAACTRLSEEEAYETIMKMKKEGKVGYYTTEWSTWSGAYLYFFIQWTPKKRFPPTESYLASDYFKPLFRDNGCGDDDFVY